MRLFRPAPAVLAIVSAAATVVLEASIPTLASLRIPVETVPPGAMAQIKVVLTEPKPISTADAFLSFGALASIEGIAITNPDSQAAAVARVAGTDVALTVISRNAALGTNSDYPLVTVTGRVPDDAPLGAAFPLPLSADAIKLLDPLGAPYPIAVKSGALVVGPSISIASVVPGGADVPAGGVVSIYGMNFRPETEVRFNEVILAQVSFIDSTRIDVVVAQPAHMHGMEIKAENGDSRTEFFSYQRTKEPKPSAHPVLRRAVPVFANGQVQQAVVQFPQDSGRLVTGIALENIGREQANVLLEMTPATSGGGGHASALVSLPVSERLVRDVSELFGSSCDTSCTVTVNSTDPIRVIGIVADRASRLRPVLPQ